MASNWQDNLTLVESLDFMLTNKIDCDVSFKLGKTGSDIVPAHKFVLAMRSSVFRAMLFGPLAEKDGIVETPDLESDTFTCFLQYLYTDQCSITAENVLALMYAANKYNIGQLVKKCDQFMRNNLSTTNVCTIMEAAHLYDNQDLRQICLKFIENHSDVIMEEKLLSDLGQECLGHVLRSDNLKASEEDIFTAVLSWADRRCTEKDLEVNDSNRRQVLGDLLYLLRFPLMSPKVFATISEKHAKLFMPEEQVQLLTGHITSEFSQSQFSSERRAFANIQDICYRFKDSNIHGPGWSSAKPDILQFMVSEAVEVVGLVLFGCEGATYNVHIEVIELLKMTDTTVKLLANEKTFKVLFNKPFAVKPDKYYTLKVSLGNGRIGYSGKYGMETVACKNKVFTFKTAPSETNGTNINRGQIFGIIFERQ